MQRKPKTVLSTYNQGEWSFTYNIFFKYLFMIAVMETVEQGLESAEILVESAEYSET